MWVIIIKTLYTMTIMNANATNKSILSYFDDPNNENKNKKIIDFDVKTKDLGKQKIKINKINQPVNKLKKEILKQLINFYKTNYDGKQDNKNLLIPIVKQQTTISLRLLDWLVTNYSKKYDIRYQLGKSNNSEYISSSENFNLWLEYKNQLKAFSKESFDPFCRRKRIFYNTKLDEIIVFKNTDIDSYNKLIEDYSKRDDGIVTTVGQLNFFKWAIEKEVIDYAFDNLQKIEADMLSSADARITSKKDNGGVSKPRRQLSKNNNSARYHELKVIIEFPN